MKQAVINFARSLHVYNLLRHNFVFHAFDLWRKPSERQEFDERIRRLHEFTGCNRFIAFDVGANIGQFTAPLLKLGARVISVEPDPEAAEILRVRFWARRNVAIEECAISEKTGTATFYRQHPGSQRNTLEANEITSVGGASQTVQVRLTTLRDLIEKYGAPFLLKIDVEGHEFAVLKGLNIPVPRVMFECNAPEAVQEGIRCVQRLHEVSGDYRFALSDAGTITPKVWLTQDKLIGELEKASQPIDIFARLPH